jgi:hypothetical protein
MDLSIISVHKMRQKIQNKEGRLRPSEEVRLARHKRNSEVRDYMINN